jgi:hypothetical protein
MCLNIMLKEGGIILIGKIAVVHRVLSDHLLLPEQHVSKYIKNQRNAPVMFRIIILEEGGIKLKIHCIAVVHLILTALKG